MTRTINGNPFGNSIDSETELSDNFKNFNIALDPDHIAALLTSVQGTWAVEHAQTGGRWVINTGTPLQNDEITLSLWLPKGSYVAVVMCAKGTGQGKVTVKIGGTASINAVDLYNAGGTVWDVVTTGDSTAVATSGLTTIDLKIASKNAGSSGYQILLQSLMILKVA